MTASLFMGLAKALRDTLTASPALASGEVYLNRADVLAPAKNACIKVQLADSQQDLDSSLCEDGGADWMTDVIVEILARGTGGVQAADAADAISVDVYSRVMADQTLGGLAQSVRSPSIARRVEQAEGELASVTFTFTLAHFTTGAAIS